MPSIFLFLLLAAPFATASVNKRLLKVPFSSTLLPTTLYTKNNSSNVPIQNSVVKVITTVQCGNNQTFKTVLVDTGSAILWVGAEKPYQPGPDTKFINSTFSVSYGAGSVSGPAFQDTVVIGGAVGSAQIIGASNDTSGFGIMVPFDGILGLGPPKTNQGDISGFTYTPTFIETLVADKSIDSPTFGIFINPLGRNGVTEGTGELSFGGVDESRIQGEVTWIPQNPPFNTRNSHWDFNVTAFSFGNITLGITPARTDTGSFPISLPFDQLFEILHGFNGTFGSQSSPFSGGFLSFPSNMTSTMPSLNITLGSAIFSIPSSSYIIPRNLYPSLNLTDDPTLAHSWLTTDGPGMFGLGQKWLEHVYTVYDMANRRIGFAHPA